MQTDLIIINDYCARCDIEPDFVRMLGEGGLIDVEMIDDTDCFPASQLGELERYTHLYYDLSINIEGTFRNVCGSWRTNFTSTGNCSPQSTQSF